MPGNKIPNAPESDNFAGSFMHLKLRRGYKEDYMKVEEARQGLVNRIIKILYSLEVKFLSKVC